MSECDASPDYLHECDTSHARVTDWLRGIALAENEASEPDSSLNTAPPAGFSLEDRSRSRAQRRLRGRSFPTYLDSADDTAFDPFMQYLSTSRVSEAFTPPVYSPTSPLPIACGPPTPTSTTFSPPSIYSLDSDGHENFLPYAEIDWDSEPSPSVDDDDEAGRRERDSIISVSLVLSHYYDDTLEEDPCVVHDPSTPTSAASFYAQQAAYYVPTDVSPSEEDYPYPDSSAPSPFAVTFSSAPALQSMLPTATPSYLQLRDQSSSREGTTGGRNPPTHQRTDSSTSSSAVSLSSTINVTETLAKTHIAGCEPTKDHEENLRLEEQGLVTVILPG